MEDLKNVCTSVKVIDLPSLTIKKRREIVRTPVYKRVGLLKREYMNDDLIKEHEREFVERFTNLGFMIRWICRNRKKKDGGYYPTNDFIWENKEWELKKPQVKKYNSIFNMIKKAERRGKKRFILDFGQTHIGSKLAQQLSTYNIRNPEKQIEELLILEKDILVRVLLKKSRVSTSNIVRHYHSRRRDYPTF